MVSGSGGPLPPPPGVGHWAPAISCCFVLIPSLNHWSPHHHDNHCLWPELGDNYLKEQLSVILHGVKIISLENIRNYLSICTFLELWSVWLGKLVLYVGTFVCGCGIIFKCVIVVHLCVIVVYLCSMWLCCNCVVCGYGTCVVW